MLNHQDLHEEILKPSYKMDSLHKKNDASILQKKYRKYSPMVNMRHLLNKRTCTSYVSDVVTQDN